MKTIEMRRIAVSCEKGKVTLVYSILEDADSYGIMIEAAEWGEMAAVTDISGSRSEIEKMIADFSDGSVFPVSLYDVVYDRLSE